LDEILDSCLSFVVNITIAGSRRAHPLRGEQRERAVALAAKVATERDPVKFHVLLLELNKILNERCFASRRDKKSRTNAPTE